MAGLWCIHHNQRFLVFILLFISIFYHSIAIEERLQTCGDTIDLMTSSKVHSGILKVEMPKDFSMYQGKSSNTPYCDITVMFEGGIYLQIELYYLDIMPISSDVSTCSTGLMVLEAGDREVYGGRLCREGWRWEKEHREKKQEKKVVKSTPLKFRLISDGPYKGTGFKVHFNKFRPHWPCNSHREFKCERLQRCVHDDITCDGWDDCGDDSDEDEDAGCELLTVSEIFAVIFGVFHFVGLVAIITVFLIKYRKVIKQNRLERKESKMALEEERRSMREPSLVFPHRVNSMESVNKSHYSRSHKMDLDSLMDRMELDKADKFSCKDNMSERSYKSNATRRNRMASQASIGKEKSVGRSNPDISEKDEAPRERGRAGREEDKDPEKKRSMRYSDDEDEYDSERERRRRRRSRDRRRYDRSDDEDYDSDYERRRRRRSRSRYDSEDEDDSDRERRRRRRNRRYEDSEDDFDSDSERRRRRRSRDRRRYDTDEEDDSEKRRSKKNLDEEDNNDNDKENDRRRRSSRDRRRYDSDDESDSDRRRRRRRDSDEYDSDRDRRRRRSSRDRRSRSRDLSQEKLDTDPTPKPSAPSSNDNSDKGEKPQEPSVKPQATTPPPPPPHYATPHKPQQSDRQRPGVGDPDRPRYATPNPPRPKQQPDQERPAQRTPPPPSKQEVAKQPLSTPPNSYNDPQRYKRRTPRPDTVSPSPQPPSNGTSWMPRSERKRNRRSRGDPAEPQEDDRDQDIYEDVTPKIHLENLGYREESV